MAVESVDQHLKIPPRRSAVPSKRTLGRSRSVPVPVVPVALWRDRPGRAPGGRCRDAVLLCCRGAMAGRDGVRGSSTLIQIGTSWVLSNFGDRYVYIIYIQHIHIYNIIYI